MKATAITKTVAIMTTLAILGLGYSPISDAGVIDTQQLIDLENRSEAISRIEATLLRDDVARQLVEHGVDTNDVLLRVNNLTTAELMALDGQIGDQAAGASALGVIGAVFLVLLILEVVGVTDVFKSI